MAQKTLEQMTVEELKALGYDQVKILSQAQVNVNLIEAELAKRKDGTATPTKKA